LSHHSSQAQALEANRGGDFAAAAERLRRATDLMPSFADAHWNLGR
jgi:Flp pilus assembly protein TadD